jgi:hypothetical protein
LEDQSKKDKTSKKDVKKSDKQDTKTPDKKDESKVNDTNAAE